MAAQPHRNFLCFQNDPMLRESSRKSKPLRLQLFCQEGLIIRRPLGRRVLMRSKLGKPALLLLCLSLACITPQLIGKKRDKPADPGPNEHKRAVQALNRLTFGPRPGDVQQVMAMGVDRWIDLQLHPDKIQDNALEARLAPLRTLHMNSRQLAENFPDNQMIKQVYDGKRPMPSDPALKAVYQVQIARYQDKVEAREQKEPA